MISKSMLDPVVAVGPKIIANFAAHATYDVFCGVLSVVVEDDGTLVLASVKLSEPDAMYAAGTWTRVFPSSRSSSIDCDLPDGP